MGSFDYAELAAEHPFTATVWFCSFTILVSLIMGNMALAIVLDVYTEVKADAAESDEIWVQAADVFKALWSNRHWLKLMQIKRGVDEKPDIDWYTVDVLCDTIENITPEQAEFIIDRVYAVVTTETEKGLSMSDAMKMVGWIKLAMNKIEKQIDCVLVLENADLEMMNAIDEEGEFLHDRHG